MEALRGDPLRRQILRVKKPNKAPEPTTTAVTPRAIVSGRYDMMCGGARGAPAVVAAHLY
jgi:hypothetical protein